MKNYEIQVQTVWFEKINKGEKTIEGRLAKGKFVEIQQADCLLINGESLREIEKIVHYPSFKEMLEVEGLNKVLPGICSLEEAVNVYRQFYSEEDEKQFGVIAFRLKPIKEN